MEKQLIYTIGHSTHQLDYFLELLKIYSINCIIDIRSIPMSSYNPQFNKDYFSNYLKTNGVSYLLFAEEFGARQNDPDLLDEEGKVDFELVRKTWKFKNGIDRIWQGIEKGYRISLMCSESDPFDCHRFSMISIALKNDGFEVKHILKDKSIINNEQLENQLLKKYEKKLPVPTMFEPDITLEDQLKAAYKFRNKDIAFSPYSKIQEDNYD
jgi:uncharacterized protein (DUF488 family)